jgi:hypothetical protein
LDQLACPPQPTITHASPGRSGREARERIYDALVLLDDTISEIRDHVLGYGDNLGV